MSTRTNSDADDIFSHPERLRFSGEQMAKVQETKRRLEGACKTGCTRVKGGQSKFKFYQFPASVLEPVAQSGRTGQLALLVLMALLKRHFSNGQENPLKLTTKCLESSDISRGQKRRALMFLEKRGFIMIQREPGRNPLVTLPWRPLKE